MFPSRYIQSFHSKYVKLESGCWEWKAGRFERGYGKFNKRASKYGISSYAHRASWQIHFGEIPDGMQVCHKCDNPCCVNPEHLFLGSAKDNMEDASHKGRMYGWKRPSGENHGRAKLSRDQVELIREDPRPRRVIAESFGVSLSRVSKIKQGVTWSTSRKNILRKLTLEEEELIVKSDKTDDQLSLEYGVCRSTISKIRRLKHEA